MGDNLIDEKSLEEELNRLKEELTIKKRELLERAMEFFNSQKDICKLNIEIDDLYILAKETMDKKFDRVQEKNMKFDRYTIYAFIGVLAVVVGTGINLDINILCTRIIMSLIAFLAALKIVTPIVIKKNKKILNSNDGYGDKIEEKQKFLDTKKVELSKIEEIVTRLNQECYNVFEQIRSIEIKLNISVSNKLDDFFEAPIITEKNSDVKLLIRTMNPKNLQ